jgi:hypothetical protein
MNLVTCEYIMTMYMIQVTATTHSMHIISAVVCSTKEIATRRKAWVKDYLGDEAAANYQFGGTFLRCCVVCQLSF